MRLDDMYTWKENAKMTIIIIVKCTALARTRIAGSGQSSTLGDYGPTYALLLCMHGTRMISFDSFL